MEGIDIIQAISSVGFPICGCLLMGYFIWKKMEKLEDIVDNNTKAMIALVTELRRGSKDADTDRK